MLYQKGSSTFLQGHPDLSDYVLRSVVEWGGVIPEPSERIAPYWILDMALNGVIPVEIDDRQYTLGEGKMHLYPPGAVFFEGPTGYVQDRFICFEAVDDLFATYFKNSTSHLIFNDPEHIIKKITGNMLILYEKNAQTVSIGLQGLLLLLLEYLQHAYPVDGDCYQVTSYEKTSSFVSAVNKLLSEDLNKNRSMQDVAAHMNMSVSSLFHKYKEETGLSPYQARIKYRLDQVKQLLTATGMTLEAIAEKTGFSSPAHLSRLFTQKTGINPSDYREKSRSNNKAMKHPLNFLEETAESSTT